MHQVSEVPHWCQGNEGGKPVSAALTRWTQCHGWDAPFNFAQTQKGASAVFNLAFYIFCHFIWFWSPSKSLDNDDDDSSAGDWADQLEDGRNMMIYQDCGSATVWEIPRGIWQHLLPLGGNLTLGSDFCGTWTPKYAKMLANLKLIHSRMDEKTAPWLTGWFLVSSSIGRLKTLHLHELVPDPKPLA